MKHPWERFRLLVEVGASDVPAAITLRRFLKQALRSFGIRCVAIEPTTAADQADKPARADDARD